jgi:hypothetical protein
VPRSASDRTYLSGDDETGDQKVRPFSFFKFEVKNGVDSLRGAANVAPANGSGG